MIGPKIPRSWAVYVLLCITSLVMHLGCRPFIDGLIHTDKRKLEGYFQDHEAGWMAMANSLRGDGLLGKDKCASLSNKLLASAVGDRHSTRYLTNRFTITVVQDQPTSVLIVSLVRKTNDFPIDEHWVFYYVPDENEPEAISVRLRASKRVQAGPNQWSGYYWSFGQHWVGERVK